MPGRSRFGVPVLPRWFGFGGLGILRLAGDASDFCPLAARFARGLASMSLCRVSRTFKECAFLFKPSRSEYTMP